MKPTARNLPKIILSSSTCFVNQSLVNTSISLIYVLTPSISLSSSSILDCNISLEAHMPIGRQLNLNFPNSLTIFVVTSEGEELSYKFVSLITEALFLLFVLSILTAKVYMYRPSFICTGHITSYLYRNFLPVTHVLLVLHFRSGGGYYLY